MIRIFKSNHPLTIVPLIVTALLLRAVVFLFHGNHAAEFYNPLGKLLLWTLAQIPFDTVLVQHLLAAAIIVGQALYFNHILIKYKIVSRGNFLSGYCFLIVSSLFTDFLYLSPALTGNFFLLLVIDKLFSIYRNEKMSSEIFDLGFVISVGSLFYFPLIAFLGFLFLGMAIIRPVRLNELFIMLTGVVIPYFLTGVYYFWNDELHLFLQNIFVSPFQQHELGFKLSYDILLITAAMLLISAWSVYIIQLNYFKTVVQIRNYFVVLFWLAALGFLSLFFLNDVRLEHFMWLIIPCSAAIAYSIPEMKKAWMGEIVHLVLLLLVIFFQYKENLF